MARAAEVQKQVEELKARRNGAAQPEAQAADDLPPADNETGEIFNEQK